MSKRPENKSARQRARESRERHTSQNQTITYVAAALAVLVGIFVIWQVIVASNNADEATTPGDQLAGACEGEGELFGDGVRPLADVPPADRNGYYGTPPAMIIDTNNCYEAVIATEKGDIRLRLFEQVAPVTVNNFAFLATEGFYDGVVFHRVMEEFMAQGGDPTGTGTGGPGYQFEDEIDPAYVFDRRGLLAMANSGPATNGSQFFITFDPAEHLNGAHTIFGEVIEGDAVLDEITRTTPDNPTGAPDVMEQVDIYEYQ